MRKTLFSLLFAMFAVSFASAQTVVTKTDHLAWDMPAGDLGSASTYTYTATLDNNTTIDLSGVVCSGTATPFLCVAPFPPLQPGQHVITLVAKDPTTLLVSLPSNPFTFTLGVVPATPVNIRVVKG